MRGNRLVFEDDASAARGRIDLGSSSYVWSQDDPFGPKPDHENIECMSNVASCIRRLLGLCMADMTSRTM